MTSSVSILASWCYSASGFPRANISPSAPPPRRLNGNTAIDRGGGSPRTGDNCAGGWERLHSAQPSANSKAPISASVAAIRRGRSLRLSSGLVDPGRVLDSDGLLDSGRALDS